MDDDYHKARSPNWDKIVTPLFSAANWGGQGLHPRGNFEGFVRAASKQKWLEAHGIEHWTHFYTDYGREQQLRFFDHFLHGKKASWAKQPKVLLQVRHIDKIRGARRERMAAQAHAAGPSSISIPPTMTLTTKKPSGVAQAQVRRHGRRPHVPDAAAREGDRDHRPVGAQAVRLVVDHATPISSSCCACSPATSRKSCSRARSIRIRRSRKAGCAPRTASSTRNCRRPTAPITPTTRSSRSSKGKPVELDIEIWPTSIVVPAGYRVGLSIRGKDYEYGGASGGKLSNFKNELKGCGPFLHDDPRDRPPAIFNGTTTLHFGRGKAPYLLLPIIPPKKRAGGNASRAETAAMLGRAQPRTNDRLRPFGVFIPIEPKVSFAQPST